MQSKRAQSHSAVSHYWLIEALTADLNFGKYYLVLPTDLIFRRFAKCFSEYTITFAHKIPNY